MKKKKEAGVTESTPQEVYRVDHWGDFKKYQCLLCPFDTLHEEKIKEHVLARHTSPPKPEPISGPVLFDRFGNIIKEKENG